jgi:signal transduction histidine kinase/ligand-binding sensor domain-containing protein/DNA-binding response OmpR family regulator
MGLLILLRRYLILLALLAGCMAVAQPRKYNFSRVDMKNGLSNNQVNSIYRDSIGFVWFGTTNGLNRFDGFTCKVFGNISNDTSSLEDNFVLEIFPLPGHNLFIGSRNAAAVFNAATETFYRNYTAYLGSLSLPVSRPLNIVIDKSGNYWFHFQKEGLYKYNVQSGKTLQYDVGQGPSSSFNIVHVNQDAGGGIWVIYNNGIIEQIEGTTLKRIHRISLFASQQKGTFDYRFIIDRQKKFWVWVNGEPDGVYKIDPPANVVTHFHARNSQFRLKNDLVRGVIQDVRGSVWIGTDHGGVNLVNELDNSNITYLESNENDNGSLGYNSVESIYQDNRGIVWVGTGKQGVSYLNENITQFELYRHEVGNPNSLPYNDITYFLEDKKGNFWIGTDGGGLLYFDRVRNRFTQYLHDPANPTSLSNNVVVSLCLDHENKLWIGTYLGGMDRFDGNTFTHFRNNPADPRSISDDRIWHILEDSAHILWVGTLKGGLDRYDRKTNTFTHYSKTIAPYAIHSNYISVIREDRQHNLWMGTDDGVEVLNSQRNGFAHYTKTESVSSLSNPLITDIFEDSHGRIWVGTRSGLNLWSPQSKTFNRFYTTDGLPDNIITNIGEDRNGNLWITTSKNLCQLLVHSSGKNVRFAVRNFNETNNLQGGMFGESAFMTTRHGEIVAGGSSGFNIIDLEKITISKSQPNLVFTNIELSNNAVNAGQVINRNVVLKKAMPYIDEISLDYNENVFSLEFVVLDFSHTNQYAYKLEGFNKGWMYANSDNRKVTYTNLDPGTYYFKIKATNSNGLWGSEERTLKIFIKTPFWRTPLAFIVYAMFIIGVLVLARRYVLEKANMRFEVAQQKKEAERIQALDAVKTKFFTNVSHEFRTPLSLIISPLDRLLRNNSDPDQKKQLQLVQRNAKRLLNLVNQLLDFRKMEVQEFHLQPTEGDIIQFINEVTCSFSDLSEMKNIALSFSANTERFSTFFDKDKLEKILFNLLSNAFKYTPRNGAITVAVTYKPKVASQESAIEINVSDTGIGIAPDKQEQIFERFFQNDVPANITHPGTGIGLAITKEFVKLHNGVIRVSSEPDKGTTFTVILPVLQSGGNYLPKQAFPEAIVSTQVNGSASDTTNLPSRKALPTILLVEDNDDFRFYLKDNLGPFYNVVEAENGQEAWEWLQEQTPDLIISDVMMPHMDGIELTKRVKKHPPLAETPVVLLTAMGDEEMQLESYRLGISDYIQKPFTFELLASRIKNLLSQKKQPLANLPKYIEMNPSEVEITPADEIFLKQVLKVVEKNMGKPEFTVEELSKELFMHRAGMYRKLLSLTGKSPVEFIRQMRLKRGAQFLEKSGMTIAEVAYEVGFNNPKKFSQYFKEEFGTTPSEYQRSSGVR